MKGQEIANSEFWHVVEKVYDFVLCFDRRTGLIIRKSGFDKVCVSLDGYDNYRDLIEHYREVYVHSTYKGVFGMKTSRHYLCSHDLVKFTALECIENKEMRWYSYTIVSQGDVSTLLIEDVHDRHCKVLELERQSTTDYLTGLQNRLSFEAYIEDKIEAQAPFAIVFVDLDDFKAINDSHGHDQGDCALKEIANLLKGVSSHACRYGGDEFIVCLEDVRTLEEVEPVLDKLLVDTQGAFQCGLEVSISMGLAFYPKDGQRKTDLFHSADQALYRVKRNGKKTYKMFDSL